MQVNWMALAQVLGVGLVTGVGTVVLFALGVRGLSRQVDARRAGRSSLAGRTVAVISFALSASTVALGIYVIVAG